jgi:hypothetical protein
MSNVLTEDKKQQVIALGKLGWSLRRIEEATGVRRETASSYLKTAGVVVCLPGWGRRAPAKPAIGVTTDSGLPKPAISNNAGDVKYCFLIFNFASKVFGAHSSLRFHKRCIATCETEAESRAVRRILPAVHRDP